MLNTSRGSRRFISTGLFLAFINLLSDLAHAQLPVIELHQLSRQVIQIGSQAEIELHGTRLDELQSVKASSRTTDPLAIEFAPQRTKLLSSLEYDESTNKVEIRVADAQPAGLIDLSIAGRFGLSNPRSILLSNLPVIYQTNDHHTIESAMKIDSGSIVNGQLADKNSTYVCVQVPVGQQLSVLAYARQIDSQADLHLRLLDANRKIIASSRAIASWPAEMRWINNGDTPTNVFIELRDMLYRGGLGFHYALETQTRSAAELDDIASSMHLNELLRPKISLPLDHTRLLQAAAELTPKDEQCEWEQLHQDTVYDLPLSVHSDLQRPRLIRFRAEKDQSISIEIKSSSLDQLTDPAIVLYKVNDASSENVSEELVQVLEQDDAPYIGTPAVRIRRLDPHVVWTAPESAVYALKILDRENGLRPTDSTGMLVSIAPRIPRFALVAHLPFPTNNPAVSRPVGSQMMKNGALQVHVSVLRFSGFNDPIELKCVGLPEGCISNGTIVPPNVTEADLIIQANSDVSTQLLDLQIIGTSVIQGELHEQTANYATVVAPAISTMNVITYRGVTSLGTSVQAYDTALVQLIANDNHSLEVNVGNKINIPVKLLRQSTSAAECTIRPQSLPPNTALSEFKIAGDQVDATVELNVPAETPPGEYSFWLQAETRVKWTPNPQQLVNQEGRMAELRGLLEAATRDGVDKTPIESDIATLTKRIEETKKFNAEGEFTFFVPSNNVRIKVLANN